MPNINIYLTKKIINQIGKFTCVWACVEKELFNNHCDGSNICQYDWTRDIGYDGQNILQNLKSSIHLRNWENLEIDLGLDLCIRRQEIREEWVSIINYFVNYSHNERFDNRCVKAGLMIAYRIRCNLFHGTKFDDVEINAINNQFGLFNAITKFLQFILKENSNIIFSYKTNNNF